MAWTATGSTGPGLLIAAVSSEPRKSTVPLERAAGTADKGIQEWEEWCGLP